MSQRSILPTPLGVNLLILLVYTAIFLNVKSSDVAPVDENNGGLVEAPVQDEIQELVDTDTVAPPLHALASSVQGPPETLSAGDDMYILQNREEQQIQRRETPHTSVSNTLGRMVTVGLLASVVVLLGLVFWEVINFVGDVPDPFKDVTDPNLIPVVIDDMLSKGKCVAFVVRRCRFCGIGLRALRNAGKDTVVVMVEGHPYQSVISRFLRTKYDARGFPFFILDNQRYGYLSKIVGYSRPGVSLQSYLLQDRASMITVGFTPLFRAKGLSSSLWLRECVRFVSQRKYLADESPR